jgi:hypothetical protein
MRGIVVCGRVPGREWLIVLSGGLRRLGSRAVPTVGSVRLLMIHILVGLLSCLGLARPAGDSGAEQKAWCSRACRCMPLNGSRDFPAVAPVVRRCKTNQKKPLGRAEWSLFDLLERSSPFATASFTRRFSSGSLLRL